MVASESILEFLPSNNVISREHAKAVIPPKTYQTAKLLRGKASLVLL